MWDSLILIKKHRYLKGMNFLIVMGSDVEFGSVVYVYIKNRNNLKFIQRLPFQWGDTYVLQS